MRKPLYKSLSKSPAPAYFGGAYRVNDFIVGVKAFSNVYLLETSEGSILINTAMGLEAPVVYQNLQAASEHADNIKYIVTTQGHVDHVGGVKYFKDKNPGAQYIAQAGNQDHQALDARIQDYRARRSAFRFGDLFMDAFAHYQENDYAGDNPQDRPAPDVTFEQQYHFTLGDLNLELYALKGAETNDTLVVWLPQHKICLAGNVFGCLFGHFPNLVTVRGDKYRDALDVAAAAQFVLDLQPEVVLYGRHEPILGKDLICEEVTAIRDAVLYVHDEVVKGMNEGVALHTLMQQIHLPASCELGQGYGKVAWSVRAIWEYYSGWFKHESTTELYCVPQSSIHADLLELAGTDTLVERAATKFSQGQSEQALHLLDIVLSEESQNKTAINLAIEIHRALLTHAYAGENFWLTGWIENKIKLLGGDVTHPLSFK